MPLQEQSLKHKVKIPAVHLYMKLGIMPKCQLYTQADWARPLFGDKHVAHARGR